MVQHRRSVRPNSQLRPGGVTACDGRDAGEGEAFEVGAHVVAGLVPDAEQDALAFVVAGAVLMGLAEVAECDGAVDGRHDLGESDVDGVAGEDVAAADASFRLDQAGALEGEQDLFEVRLGECGAFGDVAHRGGAALVCVQCQRQQGTAGIVTAGRDAHMATLVSRSGWASFWALCLFRGGRTWWTGSVTTSASADGPIIPDYAGANVRGIVPALLGPVSWATGLPTWMPETVATAEAVVLLVLDGLGWDQLQTHRELMPTVATMVGGPIHTVAPTTTATALTSITTGLTPGEHGLIGYRMMIGGEVMNVLRWYVGDQAVRRSHPPREVQPFEPFLGQTVPVVSVAELQSSAFSEAHLRGCDPVGWRAPSSIAVQARLGIEAGTRFVYCYYGGIDKIAHERGFGPFYDAELRAADRLVGDLLESLPAGTALLVTADHGQVDVGDRLITPSAELLAAVTVQSGEGRFRWLHTAKGAADDVAAIARDEVGHLAWIVTKEQTLDEQWFGPAMAPSVRSRLGDVALVAHEPVSFDDPADSGPFELVCRHGSLTSAEVNVPLVGALA